MRERPEYPTAVPCWVDVGAPDPDGAASFYADLFGWEFGDACELNLNRSGEACELNLNRSGDACEPNLNRGEDRAGYRLGRLNGAEVAGIGPALGDPAWNMYVRVASAVEAAAKVTAAGGIVVREPYELPGVARVAICADPAGARFRVWEPAGVEGARVVNESGTWNFNELNTDDFAGAESFYGTVFGWEASTLEFEGTSFTMWRRPGYGDFLETIDPGVHRRHQEGGAPPGFTDAIGWMQRPGGSDQPAYWSVTFAVSDADAVAERAVVLGGTVEVPPFDAGPSRITVLRDPQGAMFTANRYNG